MNHSYFAEDNCDMIFSNHLMSHCNNYKHGNVDRGERKTRAVKEYTYIEYTWLDWGHYIANMLCGSNY